MADSSRRLDGARWNRITGSLEIPLLAMNVWIVLEGSTPPSGRLCFGCPADAVSASGGGVRFEGWLDLLRALSDAIDPKVAREPLARQEPSDTTVHPT